MPIAKQHKTKKCKNVALMFVITAIIALIFCLTMVKLKINV